MIGATTSQSLDLTLLNKGDIVYGTSTIKVEIGLKIGSTIEYIPMGIYNIDDIEKTDYTIKITAFDNMMKFEKNFITNLGDTLTLQQVVNELARITEVQFTGTLPAYTVKKLEGFSCREVLSYVASICGGNAVITRDGKFTIVTPKDIKYSIGTANYFNYTREETKYKIGKISCQVADKVLSKGSLGADSMELEFENPWVTDSILQDIYSKLNGFEYLGYSMKWQGDLSLDVGDIVTITDKKGVVRKHPILSRKFSYTGGLTSEISAKGENKNKNEFSSSGPSTKKIERVFTELAIVNKALIGVAYIDDLTAGNIKFDTASGTILDLQTLLAKFVTGENGQFLNLTTDNVTISNALIKDVIAKNISVEDLKAGKISTNKFNIASDNGGIEIVGATQQFKDKSNKVRIQIGQDTQGNFNFILRGEDGTTTLIDHTGIKEKAIADNLIKEKMIAENAVGEKQINYSSLVTGLNKDTNTSLIKASKVAIDLTGQSLEVSFNSLKSNVDNMEIGGRNLVFNSTGNLGVEGWNNGGVSNFTTVENGGVEGNNSLKLTGKSNDTARKNISQSVLSKFVDLNDLKHITLSFWYKASENSNITGVGSFLRISNRISSYNDVLNSINSLILDNQWHYKSITEDLSKFNNTEIREIQLFFFTYCGIVEYSNIKLEFGTKATNWTPDIEDTESKIQANTTAITVAQGKIEGLIKESTITKGDVTTLKDNYTSIKATVDGINTTVASHTSSIGTLTSKVSTAESSITQLNNKIDLKVEQTDINKAVNSINTDNLIIDNSFENDGYGWNGTVEIESGAGVDGGKCLRLNATTSTRAFVVNKLIDVVPGQKYKVGVWYKTSSDNNGTEGNQKVRLGAESGALLYALALLPGANEWTYKEGIVTIPSDVYKIKFTVSTDTRVGYILVDNISFTNAELESNVSSIDSRLQAAELKITKDAIISTVQATINTAKTEAINNANSSTDNKLKSYSTTTAMNSAITQSANGVKTEVSNTYATKTELGQTTSRVESVEQKVTATAITTTISSAINGGTSSITTTQFVMDKNGLTIKNGALTIKNKAGTNVLASDASGNLTIIGAFINKNSNGVKAIEINNTNIYFYDWERNGRELGIIYSSYLLDYPNCRGFSLAHNSQGYLTLGYRKPDNSFGAYAIFDKYAKNPAYTAPIRFLESAVFSQAVNMQNRVYVPNTIYLGANAGTTVPMIFGTNNRLVMQVSVSNKDDGLKIQTNTGGILAQILAGYSYPILLNNNTQVSGNLSVTGSKNSLQLTDNYGERLINAIESAEYYYSDFGFGKINNDGECYISIDDILQECVNLDCEYHIFTQKYNGDITSINRHRDYFIVYGEPETKFSWQYIAKRIGYENVRLDVPDIGTIEDIPVFTDEDLEVKTVEDALLDVLTFKLEDILMEG